MVPIRRYYLFFQVPKLASAAEYFFKMGVEGKRFRPTVIATVLIHYFDIFSVAIYQDVVHWIISVNFSVLLFVVISKII